MNQIQLNSDCPVKSLQYFEDAQRGLSSFSDQSISQTAWQIISRSAMQLYNFCSMTRWPNPICTHLPMMTSPVFRLALTTAIFTVDYLIFSVSTPKQNTDESLVSFSVTNNAEELLASLTAGISLASFKIPDHSFNLHSQTRLFTSFLVFSVVAFLHKQYRHTSEKITRQFFDSIIQENVEVTKKLLLHPNLNLKSRDKYFKVTPLHIAAMYGEPYISNLCRKYIPPLNYQDTYMGTPMHYAVTKQKNDSIIALSNTTGIDINAKNVNDNSPLHFAAYGNCLDCIKALAKNQHLNWNLINGKNLTAIEVAASEKHTSVVEFFLTKKGLKIKPLTLIAAAISKGSLELLKIYQKNARFNFNAIVNSKNKETPLHYAIRLGKLEIASYLLSIPKVNLSAKNSDGETAYDVALKYKYTELAQQILEKSSISENQNASLHSISPRPITQNSEDSFMNTIEQTLHCLESNEYCNHLLTKANMESHQFIERLSQDKPESNAPSPIVVNWSKQKMRSGQI